MRFIRVGKLTDSVNANTNDIARLYCTVVDAVTRITFLEKENTRLGADLCRHNDRVYALEQKGNPAAKDSMPTAIESGMVYRNKQDGATIVVVKNHKGFDVVAIPSMEVYRASMVIWDLYRLVGRLSL